MKKIKIGIYNTYGWDLPFEDKCKKYKEHNFDCIGLYWLGESKKKLIQMVKVCKKYNLPIEIVHGPLAEMSGDIWKNSLKGFLYFRYLKMCIKLLHRFGISKFVIHGTYEKKPTSYTKRGLIRFQKLIKLCEKFNIMFLLENLRSTEHVDFILDGIKSKNLGVCIDLGHANIYPYGPPTTVIEKYKDIIYSVHTADNDGKRDMHLIPKDGKADWESIIKKLYQHYNGALMLEINNFKVSEFGYDNIDTYLKTAKQRAALLLTYINNEDKDNDNNC